MFLNLNDGSSMIFRDDLYKLKPKGALSAGIFVLQIPYGFPYVKVH